MDLNYNRKGNNMSEKVTLERLEQQLEQYPNEMIQHAEYFKQFSIFTDIEKYDYSDLEKLAKDNPRYLFMGYTLGETHLVYVGIKRRDDITEAEVEYLWVKSKTDPIYYRVPFDQIRLFNYIKPPVINVSAMTYLLQYPSKCISNTGDFLRIITEVQAKLGSRFIHYRLEYIRATTKIRKRKDQLYVTIYPTMRINHDKDRYRHNVLHNLETFGKLASFYKQYNKE